VDGAISIIRNLVAVNVKDIEVLESEMRGIFDPNIKCYKC
jgi:hypothetical protein